MIGNIKKFYNLTLKPDVKNIDKNFIGFKIYVE